MVKTPDFTAGVTGSIPVLGTKIQILPTMRCGQKKQTNKQTKKKKKKRVSIYRVNKTETIFAFRNLYYILGDILK